jgi:carboxyl-terminal processing protease
MIECAMRLLLKYNRALKMSFRARETNFVFFALGMMLCISGCAPTLTAQVFSIVDNNYVESPDFSKLQLGAFVGLSRRLPEETFNVKEVGSGLVLNYRLPGNPVSSRTFSANLERAGALRDIDFAYNVARQIAPDIDEERLQTVMLKTALEHLDRYSTFLDSAEYSALMSEPAPGTGGIGVEIAIRSGYPTVVSPISGGPAERAGIVPDDQIIAIDGVSTVEKHLAEVVKMLRGPLQSEIRITVRRQDWLEDKTFILVRGTVQLRVIQSRLLDDGIGLVTFKQFTMRASQDFEAALRRLEADGMRDLILDLRANSGGVLDQAVAIAGKFFERGTLICRTSGRGKGQTRDLYTQDDKTRKELSVLVIVDKETAAGAELLAAAIQESGRGLVLGGGTFGHGSIYVYFPMPGGSALKLTTAKWVTAKNWSAEGRGLTPDIPIKALLLGSGTAQGDLEHDIYLQTAVNIIQERRLKR